MALARVVCGALACALLLACGERAGDPVVWLANAEAGAFGGESAPDGAGGAAPDDRRGQAGAGLPPASELGPTGLCGDCTTSNECGDANDVCVRHQDERFCGRDCDDQHRCPDAYTCVELANSPLWQCVPPNGCAAPAETGPGLAEIRQNLLARINTERAFLDLDPLQASSCLDAVAQDSALAFARTDEPLGKFVNECDPIWPNCECGWSAETELSVARYALDWSTAVEQAVGAYRDSQNTRFVQAYLDFNVSDVGIGFWLSADEAWIALSFH